MKIVHISTQDYGGAGIAAYRLHKAMQNYGLDSKMIVLNKETNDNSVLRIPDMYFRGDNLTSTQENSLLNTIQWLLVSTDISLYPNRPAGLEIFTGTRTVIYFEKIKEILDADIINLHWVFGIFDYKRAHLALKNKKIVWTLHDMNPFTGGCHYSNDCDKFKLICSKCPQLGSADEKDISYENFITKQQIYQYLDISIVTPSHWLLKQAENSALFKNFKKYCIKNTHPKNVFQPYDKAALKNKFNIPQEKKVILYGADDLTNQRKGTKYLLKTLEYLKDYKEQFIIGFFGNNTFHINNFDTISFGKIQSPSELSVIYNLSDCFVIPSLEDNLPNTVAEALLSGTPVVGFKTGGIPDMVVHLQTGYLANKYDTYDLANGIKWIIDYSNDNIRFNCRKSAEEMFDEKTIVERYLNVYKS